MATMPDIDPERRRAFERMPKRGKFVCSCEHAAEAANGTSEEAGWGWARADKPKGYELYELLGRPRTIVAPMVEQSELSFRLLCKRYGADLTYSPMINSAMFTKEQADLYRFREYSTCPADTNMIAQFCGHDPELLVEGARLIEDSGCKAIDLNLGCPQGIARRGNYGAFLMDDLPLVRRLVWEMDQNLMLPVTTKIRVFPDPLHTVRYAEMLVEAGAAMLCVHGRVREAKGVAPGEASWEQIRMVREALPTIPVFANGNIWHYGDIAPCLEATGCDAVMSADSLLWDPRLFANPSRFLVSGRHFSVTDRLARIEGIHTALEYLDICRTHPTQSGQIKAHLFKMTHHSLQIHTGIRQEISETGSQNKDAMLQRFRELVEELKALEEGGSGKVDAANPSPSLEEYTGSIQQLGNVNIPDRCRLSCLTQLPDLESEYRRKKDEKIKAMLDDSVGFDIFDDEAADAKTA